MPNFVADVEIQAEIERVAGLLRLMSVTETQPYGHFGATRYVIDRARRLVEKADGIRFGTVHNVGVKRLAADEVPSIGSSGLKGIYRRAKKTVGRLSNLKAYNDMAADDRLRVAGQRMIASAVVERTSRAAIKEAEENVRTAGAAIDFGGVLNR